MTYAKKTYLRHMVLDSCVKCTVYDVRLTHVCIRFTFSCVIFEHLVFYTDKFGSNYSCPYETTPPLPQNTRYNKDKTPALN